MAWRCTDGVTGFGADHADVTTGAKSDAVVRARTRATRTRVMVFLGQGQRTGIP
jgi:hypothetical protein